MATIARAPLAVLPNASMSQSSLMVAALLGGFIVYLALAGKLQAYWSILIGGGSSAAATSSGSTTGSGGSTYQVIPPLIPGVPNSGLTITVPNLFGGSSSGSSTTPVAPGGTKVPQ